MNDDSIDVPADILLDAREKLAKEREEIELVPAINEASTETTGGK